MGCGRDEGTNMNIMGKWVRLAFSVLVAAAVISCAPKIMKLDETVPTPRHISQGDTFTLVKPIEFARGRTAVNFQGGRVVEEGGIGAYAPYCRLELAGPAATNLTIQPQGFGVTAVTYDDRAQGRAGGQLSTTYITLSAQTGGETRRMACGRPGVSGTPNFLTGDEIGAALDGYFSIGVPN